MIRTIGAGIRLPLPVSWAVTLILVVLLMLACGGGTSAPSTGRRGSSDSTRLARRARSARAAGDTLAQKSRSALATARRTARGGKGKRGTLKTQTPEEQMAERKRLRAEKRRLREEARRRKREERLAQRGLRTAKRGQRKGRRSLYDIYTLKGTVAGRYALIGSRRLEVGDIIAGKKIVEVGTDRVILEQFGTRFTVRLGEPVERTLGTRSRRRA